MEVHPNTLATELARMIMVKTGHKYLIIKTQNLFPAEGAFPVQDFFLHAIDSDYPGYKKACHQGSDRHHHGVGQKIKEIQKLHADDPDVC